MYPGAARSPLGAAAGPQIHLTRRQLEATCGPVPQYPLYYYRAPDDAFLALSSDLEPLLRLVSSPRLNVDRLVGLIASRWEVDPGGTSIAQIRRIRPCEAIRVDHEGFRAEIRKPRADRSFLSIPPEELAHGLRDQLNAAIRRAVGNARRVSVHVGGGLDSSGVLGLAVASYRGATAPQIEALAETWCGPEDDRPYLADLERELGIEAVRLPPLAAGRWFEQSLAIDGQPQLLCNAAADMLLWAASAERGADVVLVGHGGDFVCGGEVSFAHLVRRGHPVMATRRALQLEIPRHVDLNPLERVSRWVLRPIASPLVGKMLPRRLLLAKRRREARLPWFTRRFLDALEPVLARNYAEPRTPDERLSFFCEHPHFAELRTSWGQMASLTGVAPCDVFRDPDFVQFVAQIDPPSLQHGDRFRGLYRLAMRGVLPESIRLRRNKALGQPFLAAAAIAGGGMRVLESLGSLQLLSELGLVDPRAFQPTFQAWYRGVLRGERPDDDPTDGMWPVVWPLLATEAFLRKHEGRGDDSRLTAAWPSVVSSGTVRT